MAPLKQAQGSEALSPEFRFQKLDMVPCASDFNFVKIETGRSLGWLAIHSSPLGKFQAKFQAKFQVSKTSCLKNEEGGERKYEQEKDENKKEEGRRVIKAWKMAFIVDLWTSVEWVCMYTHTHTHEYIYTINKNS